MVPVLQVMTKELAAKGYSVLWCFLKERDGARPFEEVSIQVRTDQPHYQQRHTFFRRAMSVLLDRQKCPVRPQFGPYTRIQNDVRLSRAHIEKGESFFFLAYNPESKAVYHYLRFRLKDERPIDALLTDMLDSLLYEWIDG